MFKKIVKHIAKDVMFTLGLSALLMILLTYMPFIQNLCTEHRLDVYEGMIKIAEGAVLLAGLISMIEVIILELELFSKNKWIRRSIAIFIAIALGFVFLYVYGFFAYCPQNILIPLATFFVIVSVGISVCGYCVEDKRQKRDIASINEKLKEMNNSNTL